MLVFLAVLKWLGIILLGFLGFLIVAFLLVLFFPFTYRLQAEKIDIFKAKASLSFLFRFIFVSLFYQEKKPLMVVRVLGIPVYKTDFQFLIDAIKESQNSAPSGQATAETTDESVGTEDVQVTDTTEEGRQEPELSDEELDAEIKAIMEEEEPKLSISQKIKVFFEKLKLFISNCKKKCYNIYDSILEQKKKFELLIKNIKYYYKVLNHPAVKSAWKFLLKHMKKMWRNARPRKIRIRIKYGASDPADTARFYGYYCMIYPFYGKSIQFEPDLENEVFIFTGKLKGHFQTYRFMFSGLAIVLNRNCRKVVRLLKREVKKRGR